MFTFHRIKIRNGEKFQTIILKNMRQSETKLGCLISGIRVNKNGEEISGKDYDQKIEVIGGDLVVKITELVENWRYGGLTADLSCNDNYKNQ